MMKKLVLNLVGLDTIQVEMLQDRIRSIVQGSGGNVSFHESRSRPDPRQDIIDFHTKFQIFQPAVPGFLSERVGRFQVKFLAEELDEYCDAAHVPLEVVVRPRLKPFSQPQPDLRLALDALIDLEYVQQGTVYKHGLPWSRPWATVQTANMSKVRAKRNDPRSTRGESFDIVKPEGFVAPDHTPFIGAGPWPTHPDPEEVE